MFVRSMAQVGRCRCGGRDNDKSRRVTLMPQSIDKGRDSGDDLLESRQGRFDRLPELQRVVSAFQLQHVGSRLSRDLGIPKTILGPSHQQGRRRQVPHSGGMTADTRNCPETAMKLPGGGHETCPLTVMRSARHDSVCLAASSG